MKAAVRAHVRRRARHSCEYCLLHDDDLPAFSFHVEHVIARKHGHFRWVGPRLLRVTSQGGATIAVLNINASDRIASLHLMIVARVFRPE